jgi:Cu/Ag efflux protein CusF
MRSARKTAWIVVLGIGLLAGIACGGASDVHQGHGIVKKIEPATRQLTLDHEEIPGLMDAMTMTFDVEVDVPLEGLQPEDEVDFQVQEKHGRMVVTEIRRADR